ncbi:MAG: hypothetical protein H0W22_04155, partial [Chloroflexi bacterium]|nr:hypothetical protein [Chloroflexota bacterium]
MFHCGPERTDVVSCPILEVARDHSMQTGSKVLGDLARGSRSNQVVGDLQALVAERGET